MSVVSWSSSVNDNVLKNGYQYKDEFETIRTNMDLGESKVRSRSSVVTRNMNVSLCVNDTEKSDFEIWFNVTLSRGVKRFNGFTDPDDNLTTHTYRILDYTIKYYSPNVHFLDISMERLS